MIFASKIVDLKHFNPSLINYINDIVKNNGFIGTIIVLDNTKGLTTEMLSLINKSNKLRFRITGGYDNKRIQSKKGNKKEIEEEYIDSVTYTKEELYNILLFMENIEKYSSKITGDLEKSLYIYEALRKYFEYKYFLPNVTSKENSSLRCIYTKQISPKGIAILYKEILDRIGINVFYVEGVLKSDNYSIFHAWNVIETGGKFIGLDLYLDIREIRNGYTGPLLYFGDTNAFSDTHYPSNTEVVQYYENALLALSNQDMIDILKSINDQSENKYELIDFNRSDGTSGVFSIISTLNLNKKKYRKIIYYDLSNNVLINPRILYIDGNIELINKQLHFDNKVLSTNNIRYFYDKVLDLTNIRTGYEVLNGYIGTLSMEKGILCNNVHEENKMDIVNNQKAFIRSDKTVFVLEQENMEENDLLVKSGTYKVYEILNYEDKSFVYENTLYTEKDLLIDASSKLPNEVLSRDNIDFSVKNKNGYLGYYNPSEIKTFEEKE